MCPRTLIDRKRKRFNNTVDVVERLRDPTDPSTERTAPPRSAHIQLDDILIQLRPRRVSLARQRGDGDDEVTCAGLRLRTTTI